MEFFITFVNLAFATLTYSKGCISYVANMARRDCTYVSTVSKGPFRAFRFLQVIDDFLCDKIS